MSISVYGVRSVVGLSAVVVIYGCALFFSLSRRGEDEGFTRALFRPSRSGMFRAFFWRLLVLCLSFSCLYVRVVGGRGRL